MTIEIQDFDAQQWVKTRSSLDSTQSTFLTWAGAIYAFEPGEKRNRLFKMVGMSVSRCIPTEEGSWDFTSRELTYYLHPETGEILRHWENPWTGELLTVMHVANNPVQGCFKGKFPARVDRDSATFVFDLFITYPNPLATDPKFADYSPNPTYQAAELFKITAPTEDLSNPEILSVSKLQLSWDRIGPWVPWMKMGDRPGHLIYSAYGCKVNDINDLPQLLRDEINTRVPLYKNAPQSYVEGEDMTSWVYFQNHFDAYLAGETFPLPQPAES
ncbi:MAG: DUF1838 domain-containing protein [Scytolyngbya sp. HA4215-MV1]|jgi:hypothetical protein|nr:DUF1838 domain-containing protein [Scytolyngbya sp. HA4215-MV1]